MEIGAKGCLPFLCRHCPLGIFWCMVDEALKVEFAHSCEFWAYLEVGVCKVTNAISPFKKSDSRVEIRADLPVIRCKIQPVGMVDQPRAKIGLPT